MKSYSLNERKTAYQAPQVMEESFDFEGLLCGSNAGGDFGAGGFEPDPDMPEIGF